MDVFWKWLLVFCLSSQWVVAQIKEANFHRFDRDGDWIVTASELPNAKIRQRFDVNGDGEVTLAEFRETTNVQGNKNQSAIDRMDSYIKVTDTNGDSKLSREEVGMEAWFDRVDRNRDGEIDKAEIGLVRGLVKRFGERGLTAANSAVTQQQVDQITSGPEILKPSLVGIGRRIEDVEYTDLQGTKHRLSDVKQRKAIVYAMTSASCPVSKRFLPTLAKLEQQLIEQNIGLVLVNPFPSESRQLIEQQLGNHQFQAVYVHDKDKQLSATLSAATTTDVFLIDSKQTLHYRGAIDDQYGINYNLEKPRNLYLRDAIRAFLNGEKPSIAATAAPGCELNYDVGNQVGTDTETTYHRDISRIMQRNCVHCHHDSGIAPFSLGYYDEVSDRGKVIKRVVNEGTMPPWSAAPTKGSESSPWANDHSLSAKDKSDLLAWLDGGQPEGDPADAPIQLKFPKEWTLGEPDMVIPLSKAYKIQATGYMPYQRDIVKTTLTEDKWVTGYEILPSARDVVHHVIIQVSEKGATRTISEAQGYWAAYVPGNGAVQYPKGFARKLPAGATVHFQIHYTPSGEEKMERLKMGLHFSDQPPKYEVATLAIADLRLNIPPGAAAHREGTKKRVPFDLPVLSYMAHMHTRGSAFSFELEQQGQPAEMLLDIPRYDFNWQLRYELKKPKILPAGSTIKVTGVFDNSTNNKANPDPTKTVRWGKQTVDEMLIGYIEYFKAIE